MAFISTIMWAFNVYNNDLKTGFKFFFPLAICQRVTTNISDLITESKPNL